MRCMSALYTCVCVCMCVCVCLCVCVWILGLTKRRSLLLFFSWRLFIGRVFIVSAHSFCHPSPLQTTVSKLPQRSSPEGKWRALPGHYPLPRYCLTPFADSN